MKHRKRLLISVLLALCVLAAAFLPALGGAAERVELSLREDGNPYALSGRLEFAGLDPDAEGVTFGVRVRYGRLMLLEDGTYGYWPEAELAEVAEARAEGKALTETFACLYTDAEGARRKVVTRVVIAPDGAAGSDEGVSSYVTDLALGASGNISPDGEAVSEAALLTEYGILTLNADGTYRYELSNGLRAVQSLAPGEKAQETLCVWAELPDGTRYEIELIATVTGANDKPTVQSFAHTLVEDSGAYIVSGNALSGSTLGDGAHTFAWTSAASSFYGTVTLNADGTYEFLLDNANPAVQALGEGETVAEEFGYTYTDGNGDAASGSVTITVTGVSDAPTVQNFAHTLVEDSGAYTASGDALSGSTLGDGAHTFAWTSAATSAYGTVTLNADGTYEFLLDNANPAVQALGEGETLSQVFGYTYTDGNGEAASGSVTVTIAGANDAPTVQNFAHTLVEDSGAYTASGDALSGATLGDGAHTFAWTSAATSAYGTVTLNADGTYSYTLDNSLPAVQALGEGVTVAEEFGYTYTDANGDAASGSVTVTIAGANDVPKVAGSLHTLVEDSGAYTVSGNALSGSTPGDGTHSFLWKTDAVSRYGAVTLNADGTYEFVLDNDLPAVQALRAGQGVNVAFIYTYTDADGESASGDIQIDIRGANDVPKVSNVCYALQADAAPFSGDALEGSLPGDGAHTFAWTSPATSEYITITLNADGTFEVSPNRNAPVVRMLKKDMTSPEQVFAFTYTDEDGESASGSVTITVTGVNDRPAIGSFTCALTEDSGEYTVSGSMLGGALPGDGAHTFAWTSAATSPYGTLTLNADGTFEFILDNDLPAVQALGAGQQLSIQLFSCTYTDEDGDTAVGQGTVVVNGANDVPTVKSFDHNLTAGGGDGRDVASGNALTGSTLGDGAHTFTWEFPWTSPYVTVTTLNTDGTYVFVLNNANAAVQALGEGDSLPDQVIRFTYTDADGEEATGEVRIGISGPDDSPTVQSFSHDLYAASVDDTVSGNALVGSTMGRGAHTFEWTTAATSDYGTVTLNADGTYEFTLDNDNADVRAEGAGDTLSEVFTYTYTDANGMKATGSFTVVIYGVNDAPEISGCEIVVYEAALANGNDPNSGEDVASGSFTISDADGLGDIATVSIADAAFNISNGAVLPALGTHSVTSFGDTIFISGGSSSANTCTVSFTYTLNTAKTNVNGAVFHADFVVKVTDKAGALAEATISVVVVDDAPKLTVTYDPSTTPKVGDATFGTWSCDYGADQPSGRKITIAGYELDLTIASILTVNDENFTLKVTRGQFTYTTRHSGLKTYQFSVTDADGSETSVQVYISFQD